MRLGNLPLVLAELIITATVATRPALGNVFSGDLELLKATALLQKENAQSLLTWKAEATEEITGAGGGLPDFSARNHVTFAYDQIRNAVRWNKTPQEFHSGVEDCGAEADYHSHMMIDDKSYSYSWNGWTDADGTRRFDLIVGGPKEARNWSLYHFDARRFLAHPGSKEPVHDYLMHRYEIAKMPKDEGYDEERGRKLEGHVKQEGDLVIAEAQLTLGPGGEQVVGRDVFDLSRGGNLTECYSKAPAGENLYTYEYEEKAGVWILKSYTHVNKTLKRNGEYRQNRRTVKFIASTVNVPFEEDEFTPAKMGVQPGDHVHDHRVGRRHRYASELEDSELLDSAHLTAEDPYLENEANQAEAALPLTRTPSLDGANSTVDSNVPVAAEMSAAADSRATPSYVLLSVIAGVAVIAVGASVLTLRLRKE
ncbi:MAG: hypothetical protein RBS72_12395 [Sedimentisphaerales bacterium]|jgi:hypothetical protein|nr:hypothetical protein [Sedimentisphaerales bacterium]HNY78572.1 hypothetical protein [Sedimentisphaerales bacterium]HOC63770.1 hypothetical protein [Sedimentisphaerales bacterium]HOH64554.1 hypothetical protein [Sedimentisphaerales bacterium]HQN34024.1 hypothetical protein [Sedimentisphaerales bacterium]